jgi:peroxiredoxin
MVLFVFLAAPLLRAADPSVASHAGPQPDPLAVPKGEPKELAAFIERLSKMPPETIEMQIRIQEAIVKAAEQILDAKPKSEEVLFAAQAKAAALQDPQELSAFEEQLTKAGRAAAARIVHRRFLVVQLDEPANDTLFGQRLDELKKFLAAGPLQPGDQDAAMQAAEIARRFGDRLSGETYESMAKLLAAEPKFAATVRLMQARARGLTLVGNKLRLLEGKTLDGKDLNWAKYRGKVVLINFWTAGYAPCLEEIANLKASYEKFRSQGFEVIGINIDGISSKDLATLVKSKAIPFVICRDADSPQRMVEYYGVRTFPVEILVGRDGKVIAVDSRVPELDSQVETALAAAWDPAAAAAEENAAKLKLEKERKQADELAAQEEKEKREQAAKAQARQARTWTDASGKFRVTAKFRGMVNQVVKLEREDGTVISVPLEKLSDADQECIRLRKY